MAAVPSRLFYHGIEIGADGAAPSKPRLLARFHGWLWRAISCAFCATAIASSPAGNRLLPGDYMTITFSNKNDQLDGCYSVSHDGFVNMPFIGKIKAEGLSASDLTATLEREYDQRGIYKGLRIWVERMDKPPDIKPFLRDIEMLKQMESNPFWNKKGDFFTPKDRKPSSVLP
ncbi:MAG: polysaccharide biosynthesis/export family protein [Verrucomicrobiota bacterium]